MTYCNIPTVEKCITPQWAGYSPSLFISIYIYIYINIYISLCRKNTIQSKMNIVPHKQNLLALMPCLPKKIICGRRRVAVTNQVTVRRHPLPPPPQGGDDAQHQLAIVFEFYHAALDIFAIWSCIHLFGWSVSCDDAVVRVLLYRFHGKNRAQWSSRRVFYKNGKCFILFY